jgi:hypothetical protein
MTDEEVLALLESFEKRLATVADQAQETCEQAQHTLQRVNRLRDDIGRLKLDFLSAADTAVHRPLSRPPAS